MDETERNQFYLRDVRTSIRAVCTELHRGRLSTGDADRLLKLIHEPPTAIGACDEWSEVFEIMCSVGMGVLEAAGVTPICDGDRRLEADDILQSFQVLNDLDPFPATVIDLLLNILRMLAVVPTERLPHAPKVTTVAAKKRRRKSEVNIKSELATIRGSDDFTIDCDNYRSLPARRNALDLKYSKKQIADRLNFDRRLLNDPCQDYDLLLAELRGVSL